MLLQLGILLFEVVDVSTHILQSVVESVDANLFCLVLIEHRVHVLFHLLHSFIHGILFILVCLLQIQDLLLVLLHLIPVIALLPNDLLGELSLQQFLLVLNGVELSLIPLYLPQQLLFLGVRHVGLLLSDEKLFLK